MCRVATADRNPSFHNFDGYLTLGSIVMDLRKFVAELKRRSVYRAAAAYCVVGWLIVQLRRRSFRSSTCRSGACAWLC